MRTTVRLMLSVTLVGLVVMVIVFFALFGILPAQDLAKVFKKNATSTKSNGNDVGEFIYSTTTVVKRKVIKKRIKVNTSSKKEDKSGDTKEKKEPEPEENKKTKKKEKQQKKEKVEPKPIRQKLPPVVFNTSGKIKKVNTQKSVIVVNSDGSHFEVIPPSRVIEITVKVDESTNILNASNKQIGIGKLKKGQTISIEAPSNIKNDKKFVASNIKLQG